MVNKTGFLFMLYCFICCGLRAQQVEPHMLVIEANGEEVNETYGEGDSYSGSAPIKVKLTANPTGNEGRTSLYEWQIINTSNTASKVVRYDEDVDYTFEQSGTFSIKLYATFIDTATNDTIVDDSHDAITVSISESSLTVPNAFSPNGDGTNDILKVTAKGIIKFDAYIFNRWGQQLYHWGISQMNDGGWDGTSHGKQVKDGVYFIVVKAKGSDGKEYNIRHDVNILRKYEITSTTTQN